MPTQAAANSHHSNGLPTHHISGSRVEGWMGDESAGRAGVTAGSQTGAGSRGRGRREEEEGGRGQTRPLEVLSGHPSSLDSTLRHIVQQLDILTQVSYYKGLNSPLELLSVCENMKVKKESADN